MKGKGLPATADAGVGTGYEVHAHLMWSLTPYLCVNWGRAGGRGREHRLRPQTIRKAASRSQRPLQAHGAALGDKAGCHCLSQNQRPEGATEQGPDRTDSLLPLANFASKNLPSVCG